MQPDRPQSPAAFSRRSALHGAGAAGVLVAGGMRFVHGQDVSADLIRVGVIGAGGRGRGALSQTLSVPDSNVRVTAIADAFRGSIDQALRHVQDKGDKVDVPAERQFEGLDAYQRVFDHCDMVILATPPGFRPFHFRAAIEAGKHVFMEKPVCVDSYGARLCLETAKLADEKGLKVVVGLQRRYANNYRETIARIREGLAGDIIGGQVYWNGSGIWYRNRRPDQTEMQFQVNNWYHFNWLCGDHICEQHVHNIDVANWVLDRVPESAYGVGGKQQRVPGKPGEIYDHHAVNFSYAGGVRIASQCKLFAGGDNRVQEEFQGTKATVKIGEITDYSGKVLWRFSGPNPDPFQVEHDELHEAIRQQKPLNNAVYGTTSSFSAVLGRLATYSGKQWNYDEALELDFRTMPETLAWDAEPPVVPQADGEYPLPMPATFKIRSVTKPTVS